VQRYRWRIGSARTFAADALPEFSGEFLLVGILLEVVDMYVTLKISDKNASDLVGISQSPSYTIVQRFRKSFVALAQDAGLGVFVACTPP